jgi:hypothetical protein
LKLYVLEKVMLLLSGDLKAVRTLPLNWAPPVSFLFGEVVL